MRNSKLLLLLDTFSKKELGQFSLFLDSPYYNNQEVFGRLFLLIKPMLIDKTLELKGENIFEELFPNRKFDEKHLSNYTSRLLRLAQQFLGMLQKELHGIA